MGKLQTGRFERLGARTYSIKGPGALVDLDETVPGVIQLERQAGMESHYMQEWETFGVTQEREAAGQFSYIILSNPVGSGRLIVLDNFARNDTSQYDMSISRGVVGGFNAGNVGNPLDTRIPTSRQPAGRILTKVTGTSSIGRKIGQYQTSNLQEYPVVLGPDGTLIFKAGVMNETLNMSIRWAERDAAPFEL